MIVTVMVSKSTSPEYVAVITGEPAWRLLVATCAAPPDSGTVVRNVPSLDSRLTLPVGVPASGVVALTSIVNVTLDPSGIEEAELVRLMMTGTKYS